MAADNFPCCGYPPDPVFVDVPADGSCMFHAVFVTFYHSKKGRLIDPCAKYQVMKRTAAKLREAAVKYIVRNYHRPLGGVRGNRTGRELVSLEYILDPTVKGVKGPGTYAQYMSEYATYAGETELHALSGLLGCGIVVHPSGNTGNEGCEKGVYYNIKAGRDMTENLQKKDGDIVLHLAFDEHLEHYRAIVPGEK